MSLQMRHILLGLILLLALSLRLWRIDAVPPGFHFDESFEGLEAWHILVTRPIAPSFSAATSECRR